MSFVCAEFFFLVKRLNQRVDSKIKNLLISIQRKKKKEFYDFMIFIWARNSFFFLSATKNGKNISFFPLHRSFVPFSLHRQQFFLLACVKKWNARKSHFVLLWFADNINFIMFSLPSSLSLRIDSTELSWAQLRQGQKRNQKI